jgi:antitoxin (DNA-binding transcriptional repressor) of toxin-antitoxin stability system
MSKTLEISAFAPSHTLNVCLERVERGREEYLLTRNSRPVARLVPVARPAMRIGDREKVKRAFAVLDAIPARPKTDTRSIKSYIEEGRKW